jgi:hypothetical protein
VVLHNDAGFDVLDDGQGNLGFLQIDFVDTRRGVALDSVRVSRSFPDGDSLTVEFDLGGLTLATSLVARVSGRTPGSGCDSVDIATDGSFRADVRLLDVRTSSVLVVLSDVDLELPGRDVEIPDALAERLRPGDAEVSLEVRVDARLPVESELLISAASRPDRLFTGEAALYTPLLLPASPDQVVTLHQLYVVDVTSLENADQLFLDTRNRILGNRIVTLHGEESVSYSLTLHATIPSR